MLMASNWGHPHLSTLRAVKWEHVKDWQEPMWQGWLEHIHTDGTRYQFSLNSECSNCVQVQSKRKRESAFSHVGYLVFETPLIAALWIFKARAYIKLHRLDDWKDDL